MLSIALGSALTAALFATGKDIVSKKVSANADGTLSAFASFLFPLPLYAILLTLFWYLGIETFVVASGFIFYVVLRALTDTFAETFKMYAMTHSELSAATAIISLHPLAILPLSLFLTNDPLTLNIILGVLVSVLGTTIILGLSPFKAISKKGFYYAAGCAFFFALNNCFDRMSVQHGSAALSAATMTATSAVLLLIPLFIKKQEITTPLTKNFFPFSLRAVGEVGFMTLKLYALSYMSGPQMSAVMRVTLLFSVFAGGAFFKEKDMVRKSIGALCTILGAWIALR